MAELLHEDGKMGKCHQALFKTIKLCDFIHVGHQLRWRNSVFKEAKQDTHMPFIMTGIT